MEQVCVVNPSNSSVRVLVTGASGQLGARLMSCGMQRADVEVLGIDRQELDVTDQVAVREVLSRLDPDVVIHTAAYTAVDAAESNEAEAMLVNANAVGYMAEACVAVGASMIHLSTDYVFGEVEERPLLPSDPVGPLGAYARTKLAGEEAFASSGVSGAVVRVAWLYDAKGSNFLNTMLRLARERGALRVVDDQHGTPTSAPVLAEALLDMAVRGIAMPQGVWHFAHAGHTTWHGFAKEIVRVAGLNVPVEPVSTEAFPTPAQRPAWSVLDGEPLRREMGWPQLTWQEGLLKCWELKTQE